MTNTTTATGVDRFVSSREAAELLGVTQLTVQRWAAARLLPVHRYVRHLRFKLTDLIHFAEKHRREPRDPRDYARPEDSR